MYIRKLGFSQGKYYRETGVFIGIIQLLHVISDFREILVVAHKVEVSQHETGNVVHIETTM